MRRPDPVEASRHARIAAALAPLKLSLDPASGDPTLFDVPVRRGGAVLARIAVSSAGGRFSLDVHPPTAGSTSLVGHWPRVHTGTDVPSDDEVAALDGCEGTLRGLLVMRGDLPAREFPTRAAAMAVVRAAAALPPTSTFASRVAAKAVEVAAATDGSPRSRRAALDVVAVCASHGMDAEAWEAEPELGALARQAAWTARGSLDRIVRQWETGSHVGWLLPETGRSEAPEAPRP